MICETPPIQVAPPAPEWAEAARLVTGNPWMIRDLTRLYASPATRGGMRTIVERYPQSPYAPWCLHALGNLSLLFVEDMEQEALTARDLFYKLSHDYPTYPGVNEARIRWAEMLRATGDFNGAVNEAERLLDESEDNLYRFRSSPLYRKLRGEKGNLLRHLSTSCWELFDNSQLNTAAVQVEAESEQN